MPKWRQVRRALRYLRKCSIHKLVQIAQNLDIKTLYKSPKTWTISFGLKLKFLCSKPSVLCREKKEIPGLSILPSL